MGSRGRPEGEAEGKPALFSENVYPHGETRHPHQSSTPSLVPARTRAHTNTHACDQPHTPRLASPSPRKPNCKTQAVKTLPTSTPTSPHTLCPPRRTHTQPGEAHRARTGGVCRRKATQPTSANATWAAGHGGSPSSHPFAKPALHSCLHWPALPGPGWSAVRGWHDRLLCKPHALWSLKHKPGSSLPLRASPLSQLACARSVFLKNHLD